MNDTVPADLLDGAIAEISALRLACAYEAGGTRVHGEYATFPRSRRRHLDAQVEHLLDGACGNAQSVVTDTWHWSERDLAMKAAGARKTLTRSAWEGERPAARRISADTVALADYSAALDEIFWLRTLLACEAVTLEGHLILKSFPKSRRTIAEQQALRLRSCARGEALLAYAGFPGYALTAAARDAGVLDVLNLNTAAWTAERPSPANAGKVTP